MHGRCKLLTSCTIWGEMSSPWLSLNTPRSWHCLVLWRTGYAGCFVQCPLCLRSPFSSLVYSTQSPHKVFEWLIHVQNIFSLRGGSCSAQALTAPLQGGRRGTGLTRPGSQERLCRAPQQPKGEPSHRSLVAVCPLAPILAGFLDENFVVRIHFSSFSSSRKRQRAVNALQFISSKSCTRG